MADYIMLNGAILHQAPLRLGQLVQLAEKLELGGLTTTEDVLNMLRRLLITAPDMLAVVLTDEAGKSPTTEWIAEYMPAATIVEVVTDFLQCNRGLLNSIAPALRQASALQAPQTEG